MSSLEERDVEIHPSCEPLPPSASLSRRDKNESDPPTQRRDNAVKRNSSHLRQIIILLQILSRIAGEPYNDDKKREKAFDILSQTRMERAVFARIAFGRALGDVRAYESNLVRAKLFPPKKKRVIETTTGSSFPTKEMEKTSRKALSPL